MGKYTAIDDPSAYFQTALYTGNAGFNTITNDGNSDLAPDFIWGKCRSTTKTHFLYDTTRGAEKRLESDNTGVEDTGTNGILNFYTDGFRTASGNTENDNGESYVAWQWKANGGTTSSNTDGSKTATVQTNTDAGFSIVTYAGSGSASTVGHGLADTPDVIIFKNRSAANVWATYHQGLGNNLKLELNSTNAQDSDGSFMNGTLPTSSVFSVGASVNTNGSGSNYVAYCFAEKQGYSKFGKYVGNGNADGTFVYTGFRPAFLLWKITSTTGDWRLVDTKRGVNGAIPRIKPNATSAEGSAGDNVDLLSNGFKFRSTAASANASGASYIYMAFADNPFTTSTGIMGTAR